MICNFCNNKTSKEWLSIKQYDMLVHGFLVSIKNVQRLFIKPSPSNSFMEVFEKEWNAFQFADYQLMNKVIRSPYSLVPVFEDKYRKNLPDFLRPHENEYQELKNAIRQFLSIRHLIYSLRTKSDNEKLNEFPFVHEQRDVYEWKIGETVVVEMDKTLVLCNLQIEDEFQTRYVVLDPEFFILVAPDFDDVPLKKIRIEIKAPQKNIQTKIDFRDLKRLTIGISELTDKGEEIYNSFLLHFESAYSWRSVKKTIDDNKKSQIRFLDTLINSYFDQCIEDVQDEDAI